MNATLKKVFQTRAGAGITVLRLIVGIAFMLHGSQKLFGAFGGYGLEGTGQYMDSLGLHPGYLMALLSGCAEFFGGVAFFIGLLVRPAAIAMAFLLLMAIFSVHIHNGFFMANNGYEYALALLAGVVAVFFDGAGKLSLDQRIAG